MITDGLHHHGNIEVVNDINYLHGYGLKPINKLGLGFFAQGRIFSPLTNWVNPIYKYGIGNQNRYVAISPKLGLIAIASPNQNNVKFYDKNLNLISTVTANGMYDIAIGVAENGNFLIAYDNKLSIVGAGAIVQKTVTRTIYTSESVISIYVDSKRDRFIILTSSGSSYHYQIGQYSTLTIKYETQTTGAYTNIFDTFLTDGRFASVLNSYVTTIRSINSSTYAFENQVNQSTPVNNRIPKFYDQSGKFLCQNSSTREVFLLDLNTFEYTQIGIFPTAHNVYDADKSYFFTGSSNFNYNVVSRATMQTIYTFQGSDNVYPSPMSLRGKMPQCRAFHK